LQVYLPLAEMPVNIFLILLLGMSVGFIAGLFGVGGGFLLTPLLILNGIPANIAVGTGAAHISASSMSGSLAYWRKKALDFPLALMLLCGALLGSWLGVMAFSALNKAGQLDVVIAIGFATLLGFIGYSMLSESLATIKAQKKGTLPPLKQRKAHNPLLGLPFKMRFKRSKLYISLIPVLLIGLFIGFLGAILGIGGGFLLIPALVYILRVPASLVVGTTLIMTLFTMSVTVFLQAYLNQSVDAVLALPLIIGGVIGAQFGTRLGFVLKGEWLRLSLSLLLLSVAARFIYALVISPQDPFSVTLLKVL
jgi:uncharacterized protein